MTYSFCTLFDRNYLDRGLVLIDSFRNYNKKSKIYILAMDLICYEILQDLHLTGVILVKLSDFETKELLEAKKSRSRGEYCWTCGANFIYYVMTKFSEEYCTYLDADMRFYGDPDQLIDEMVKAGKSVQIIEHRFRNGFAGKIQEELSGKYCVEFNTFKNDAKGMEVLNIWRRQTIEQCEDSDNRKHFGDQLYLEHWAEDYDCVHVLKNQGAGLAPWNINRYGLLKADDREIWTRYDDDEEPVRVIFYHYHDLKYVNENKVNIGVHKRYWKLNMDLTYLLYKEYIKELNEKRKMLENEYGVYPAIKEIRAGSQINISVWGKIKKLFYGNAYKNIRFRLGNYIKLILFGKYDEINLCNFSKKYDEKVKW